MASVSRSLSCAPYLAISRSPRTLSLPPLGLVFFFFLFFPICEGEMASVGAVHAGRDHHVHLGGAMSPALVRQLFEAGELLESTVIPDLHESASGATLTVREVGEAMMRTEQRKGAGSLGGLRRSTGTEAAAASSRPTLNATTRSSPS